MIEKEKIINDILLKGKTLENIEKKFLNDVDIALVGVGKNAWNYIYLPNTLKVNKKLALLAIRGNKKLYSHLDEGLKIDENILIELLKDNIADNIEKLDKKIIKNEVLLKVLEKVINDNNKLNNKSYLEIIKSFPGVIPLGVIKDSEQTFDILKIAIEDREENINELSDTILGDYNLLEKLITIYKRKHKNIITNNKILTKDFSEYLLVNRKTCFEDIAYLYKDDKNFIERCLKSIKKLGSYKSSVVYTLGAFVSDNIINEKEIFDTLFDLNNGVISRRVDLIIESPYFETIMKNYNHNLIYYLDVNKLSENRFWQIYENAPMIAINNAKILIKNDNFCIKLFDKITDDPDLIKVFKRKLSVQEMFEENDYVKKYLIEKNLKITEESIVSAIISLKKNIIERDIKKSEKNTKKIKF